MSSASATSKLIGPGNAASLFPTIPPVAIPSPIPDLNAASTTVIGAGNAARLFPEITPAPVPSPAPESTPSASPAPGSTAPGSSAPAAERSASPAGRVADAFARASGMPVLAAQVVGLSALALAFLLAVTRLSLRRRK